MEHNSPSSKSLTLQLVSGENVNHFPQSSISSHQYFRSITNLTVVGSGISKLPAWNWPSLFPALTHLYANNLNLRTLAAVFASDKFERLLVLELRGNHIKKLTDEVFSSLVELEELSLENSHIEELNEGAFKGLSRLRILDLKFNEITVIPERLFHGLPELFWLHLDGNHLSEIGIERFAKNQKLSALTLRENHLTNITYCREPKKTKIYQLFLTQNRLSTVPLELFPELHNLDLSRNPNLTFNERTFANNRHIQELLLYDTGLDRQEHWHQALGPLVSLKHLAIGDNRIKQLNIARFPRLEYLEHLDLKGCDLAVIDVVHLKQQFPRLQQIETNENDLNCKSLATMLADGKKLNITVINDRIELLGNEEWATCDGKMYQLIPSSDQDAHHIEQSMLVQVFGLLLIFVSVVGLLIWRCRMTKTSRQDHTVNKSNRNVSVDSFEAISTDDAVEDVRPNRGTTVLEDPRETSLYAIVPSIDLNPEPLRYHENA